LKEVLYAADPAWIKEYLDDRINARAEEFKAAREIITVVNPESPQAVDEIYSRNGDEAVIAVTGPLSNSGPDAWDKIMGYGGTSYRTIIAAIDRAKSDPSVSAITFAINSPGGEVDGIDAVWNAHAAAGKKTAAVVSGIMASGAYWLAAPAGKILASSPTDRIGSIGVRAVTIDTSGLQEAIGVKKIEIISKNAPLKSGNLNNKEVREGLQAEIDAMERIFYARVSEGRGVTGEHIAEHFGKGGLLVASDPSPEHEDAIRSGMIDGLAEGHFRSAAGRPLSAQEQKEIISAIEDSMKPGAKFFSSGGKELPPPECEETRREIISIVNEASCEAEHTPAQAGNREDKAMTLSEFLAQNPSAKTELDHLKAGARTAGRDEAGAEFSAKVERMLGVITSKAYPDAIKSLAGDVLAGKKGIDAFDAAVAVHDTQKEAAASAAAQAETEALGGVTGEAPDGKAAGEKELDAAVKAELDKRRNAHA
jgi:ClpP class serine protease